MTFLSRFQDLEITKAKARLERCAVLKDTGCIEWSGFVNDLGYGRLLGANAHRWSYALNVRDFPIKAFICHHCDNRRCINPSHLYLGNAASNVFDITARGRRDLSDPNFPLALPALRRVSEEIGAGKDPACLFLADQEYCYAHRSFTCPRD